MFVRSGVIVDEVLHHLEKANFLQRCPTKLDEYNNVVEIGIMIGLLKISYESRYFFSPGFNKVTTKIQKHILLIFIMIPLKFRMAYATKT